MSKQEIKNQFQKKVSDAFNLLYRSNCKERRRALAFSAKVSQIFDETVDQYFNK